jgi:integrase
LTVVATRFRLSGSHDEDLQADADGFATVIVRKSKTDQTGKGDSVAITPDAMHHLRAWLVAASIEGGPLFRSVNRHGHVGRRLDQGSISAIFKAMAKRARLKPDEVAQISAHSTRVGACQDMVRYGADIAGAMQAGRWQSTRMVSRYCKELELKRAVAHVAARREKFV